MNPPKTERNNRVVELRHEGLQFNEIAEKLEEEGFDRITGERVRIIWHREQERGNG